MMIRHPRTRDGFSLLELLVVMAIIALLLALSFSGIMSVRKAQQVRSTTTTIQKVQSAVDARYKAIIAQAQIDISTGGGSSQDAQSMIDFFNGDREAAKALLTYARLRQAFPQTFAEVSLPNTFTNSAGQTIPYFTAGNYIYPVKSEFLPFVGVSPGSLQPWQQSAALLYAAVSQTGVGGSAFNSDDAMAGNQMDLTGAQQAFRVYMDAWRQPIGFNRFGYNVNGASNLTNGTVSLNTGKATESLQDPPYVSNNPNNVSNDPLDPAGKLQTWGWASSSQYSALFININDLGSISTFTTPMPFNGSNRLPVVFSVGPNGFYESLNMTKLGSTYADDIMGYQYTQLGQSGIK